jgi:hypothetical protein
MRCPSEAETVDRLRVEIDFRAIHLPSESGDRMFESCWARHRCLPVRLRSNRANRPTPGAKSCQP